MANQLEELMSLEIPTSICLIFKSQLGWLMSSQLFNNKLSARKEVLDDLEAALKFQFPNKKLLPYGSCEYGLALKESDVDFFFDATGNFSDDNKVQHQYEEIPDSELKETFDKVFEILSSYPVVFGNIVANQFPNVPTISFYHRPSNTNCDVSFKNGFGIFNTKLVKFCLTLDGRIKALAVIIKCWAREQNLFNDQKVSNYPLLMLIFFYLQISPLSLIPLMRDLKIGPLPVFYKKYNVNFNENIPPTTHNFSSVTIALLLQQFFSFYSEFDFKNEVICLQDGEAPRKTDVQMEMDSGIPYPELNDFACLQDPIELKRNVLSGWSEKLIKRFQTLCLKTVERIEYAQRRDILPLTFERIPENSDEE